MQTRTCLALGGVIVASLGLLAPSGGPIGVSAEGAVAASDQLAFTRFYWADREGHSDIFVAQVKAGLASAVKLPNTDFGSSPAWSPDGAKIAYAKDRTTPGRYNCYEDIWVMRWDGRGQRRLTKTSACNSSPAWSPDGRAIAFVREGDIYLMNSDGTAQRALVADACSPSWSPDGTMIVYSSGRACAGEIVRIDVKRGVQRRLTRFPGAASPAWSPDGERIAFIARSKFWRPSHIYVMNADGTERRRLTENAWAPAWSPDGEQIAFNREQRTGQHSEIYVMNADGSGERRVTRARNEGYGIFASSEEPAWRPS